MRDTEFNLPSKIHWEKPRHVGVATFIALRKILEPVKYLPKIITPYSYKPTLYGWQTELMTQLEKQPDNRKIYWLWSHRGEMGKSTMTKHLVVNHKAVFCSSGKQSDIINVIHNSDMDVSKIVVFDLQDKTETKLLTLQLNLSKTD